MNAGWRRRIGERWICHTDFHAGGYTWVLTPPPYLKNAVGYLYECSPARLCFMNNLAGDFRLRSPATYKQRVTNHNAAIYYMVAIERPKQMALLLKSKVKKSSLLKEGHYSAKVSSVKGKPDETNPRKILIGFKIAGYEPEVFKELPASFELDSFLVKDMESILGKGFTKTEIEEGVDLTTLNDKPCSVMVMHKSGSGGRPAATVTLVSPAEAPKPEPK